MLATTIVQDQDATLRVLCGPAFYAAASPEQEKLAPKADDGRVNKPDLSMIRQGGGSTHTKVPPPRPNCRWLTS